MKINIIIMIVMIVINDELLCPDFTVSSGRSRSRDEVDELVNIDSCEYIWEKGVGCAQSMAQHSHHHHNRLELLRSIMIL